MGYLVYFFLLSCCHNFLVILNDNYLGFNFVLCYGYNLISQTEINPVINLKITKEQLGEMKPPGPADSQNRFFKRLSDVYKLRDLELYLRKIK